MFDWILALWLSIQESIPSLQYWDADSPCDEGAGEGKRRICTQKLPATLKDQFAQLVQSLTVFFILFHVNVLLQSVASISVPLFLESINYVTIQTSPPAILT